MKEFLLVIIVIALLYTLYKLFELIICRKERILFIEKLPGIDVLGEHFQGIPWASWTNKTSYTNLALRAGCFFSGMGLGLLLSYVIVYCSFMDVLPHEFPYNIRTIIEMIFFACMLLGGGIGLIVAYLIEQKHDKKLE